MIERIYILESVDLVAFYGVNNAHMQLIKTLFPKLRIVARGNVMKIIGEEEELDVFIKKIREIEEYCEEYNALTEDVILDIAKGRNVAVSKQDNLIIHGVSGRAIVARTENQQRLVKSFEENDLVFTIGPAGSGKTFVAIALAVRALKNKQVRKIILSRPAVEAGEKLGFLPGEMKDKLDPYLQPLYDALQEMIPAVKLKEYMENNVIQIAPLAYMRGRTLNDAVIILDEAQNTTSQQIKMFLTRLGLCAKMIVTGDITQIDLPPTATSGLVQAMQVLRDVPGIGKVAFTKNDIVRHKLVQRIVEAYENTKTEAGSSGNREKNKIISENEKGISKDGI
ncbi:MAG: PhoH family protein [Tannerella sp.]|jgi:phosphate starvation-inducible PhoH-like protein|nr:PhoH family protein [Tannerella sp.]